VSCCNSGCTACTDSKCTGTSGGTPNQNTIFQGPLTITNSADIQTLTSVTEIDGDVTINSTALSSLQGLNNVVTIDGNLSIQSNGSLTTLSGLNSLAHVTKNVTINSNNVLTSLTGLGNLTAIDGSSRFKVTGRSAM